MAKNVFKHNKLKKAFHTKGSSDLASRDEKVALGVLKKKENARRGSNDLQGAEISGTSGIGPAGSAPEADSVGTEARDGKGTLPARDTASGKAAGEGKKEPGRIAVAWKSKVCKTIRIAVYVIVVLLAVFYAAYHY